jgi:hypothetical protein
VANRARRSTFSQSSETHLGTIQQHCQDIKGNTTAIRNGVSTLSTTIAQAHNSAESHFTSLERGIDGLTREVAVLGQQSAAHGQQLSQITSIIAQNQAILQILQQPSPQILEKFQNGQTSFKAGFNLRLGSFSFKVTLEGSFAKEKVCRSRPQRRSNRKREDPVVDMRLPIWFVRTQYWIAVLQSTSGWMYKLRSHCIVDGSTPLMDACRHGNIAQAQKYSPCQQLGPTVILRA